MKHMVLKNNFTGELIHDEFMSTDEATRRNEKLRTEGHKFCWITLESWMLPLYGAFSTSDFILTITFADLVAALDKRSMSTWSDNELVKYAVLTGQL